MTKPTSGGAQGASDTTDGPATVTILLDGKNESVPLHPGETLLESARRAGLAPPFSCEAGNCGTCMAMLTRRHARPCGSTTRSTTTRSTRATC